MPTATEQPIYTLRATVGVKIREESFEGRKYLVAPAVMMAVGVHNNAFYPADELEKSVSAWNGRPVPLYHPEDNGRPITANDPKVLEKTRLGWIFNASFSNDKLKAEVWVDIEKASVLMPQLVAMIRNGEQIEVSTGLFGDSDPVEGDWNGKHYTEIVRNHRPDHFALLPGGKGACSWEDGAGIPRINADKDGQGEATKSRVLNTLSNLTSMVTALFGNGKQAPPTPETDGGEPKPEGEHVMPTKDLVDKILSTPSVKLNESHRESLEKLDEVSLTALMESLTLNAKAEPKVEPKVEPKAEPKVEPKANQDAPKQPTLQEFLNSAPPEVREMVSVGIRTHNEKKAEHIAAIKANESNQFTDEFLNSLSLDALSGIVALLPKPQGALDFSLRGNAAPITNAPKIEALPTPTIEWKKGGN